MQRVSGKSDDAMTKTYGGTCRDRRARKRAKVATLSACTGQDHPMLSVPLARLNVQ
jgi:hypothetical protein